MTLPLLEKAGTWLKRKVRPNKSRGLKHVKQQQLSPDSAPVEASTLDAIATCPPVSRTTACVTSPRVVTISETSNSGKSVFKTNSGAQRKKQDTHPKRSGSGIVGSLNLMTATTTTFLETCTDTSDVGLPNSCSTSRWSTPRSSPKPYTFMNERNTPNSTFRTPIPTSATYHAADSLLLCSPKDESYSPSLRDDFWHDSSKPSSSANIDEKLFLGDYLMNPSFAPFITPSSNTRCITPKSNHTIPTNSSRNLGGNINSKFQELMSTPMWDEMALQDPDQSQSLPGEPEILPNPPLLFEIPPPKSIPFPKEVRNEFDSSDEENCGTKKKVISPHTQHTYRALSFPNKMTSNSLKSVHFSEEKNETIPSTYKPDEKRERLERLLRAVQTVRDLQDAGNTDDESNHLRKMYSHYYDSERGLKSPFGDVDDDIQDNFSQLHSLDTHVFAARYQSTSSSPYVGDNSKNFEFFHSQNSIPLLF